VLYIIYFLANPWGYQQPMVRCRASSFGFA